MLPELYGQPFLFVVQNLIRGGVDIMQALLTDRCGHNGSMPHLCRLRPSLYRSNIVSLLVEHPLIFPVSRAWGNTASMAWRVAERKRPREHGHGNGEQGYGEQGCVDTPSHRRIKTAAHMFE